MPVLALRSLLFYLGYVPVILVFATFCFTLGLLMPYLWRQHVVTWGNHLVICWLSLTCNIRVVVAGEQNIPPTPFVALSKHQSGWETYFLQHRLRPVSTILKQELLRLPFFGWGLATMRPIAINRRDRRQALKQVMEQGKKRLLEGNNVVIYPEGTRIAPGQAGNYGRSGAALAIAAGVPVLPIALNAGNCWPAHRFIKYPGTIHVVFGETIPTEGRGSRELMEDVKTWIESTMDAIDSGQF